MTRFHQYALATLVAVIAFSPAGYATFSAAYVDLQKAVRSTDAGRDAVDTLESEAKNKKASFDKQQETFKKEYEAFQKKKAIMNDSAREAKDAEFQKRYMDLQKNMAQTQMEFQNKERELTKPILDEITAIAESIAKEKNYQMVLEKQASGVLYADPSLDLTQDVIKKVNSRSKSLVKKRK